MQIDELIAHSPSPPRPTYTSQEKKRNTNIFFYKVTNLSVHRSIVLIYDIIMTRSSLQALTQSVTLQRFLTISCFLI